MPDDPFNYSGKLAFLRRACLDSRLRRTDIAVIAVILDYANRHTGRTHISVSTMVKGSGVGRSTVIRAIKKLTDNGYMTADKVGGATSNYTLTSPDTGTSPDIGTGTNWSATGTKTNLRRGQTSPDTGTRPVPTPGHKQGEIKATGEEQGQPARISSMRHPLNAPHIPRDTTPEDLAIAQTRAEIERMEARR